MNELAPGGTIHPHVHSFEEGFYILSGEAVRRINGRVLPVGAGDYAAVKVGTARVARGRLVSGAVAADGGAAAEARRPERDTFFVKDATVPVDASRLDLSHLNGNLLGHFDVSQIPAPSERKALGPSGLEGVFLKWMIDENFGARHHRLLFIEYQPGVSIAPARPHLRRGLLHPQR